MRLFGFDITRAYPEQEDRSTLALPSEDLKNALTNPGDDFWYSDLPRRASAGIPVNDRSALNHPAFYAALRIRAQTISTLPLVLYIKDGQGGELRAENHPLYDILHARPNRFQTTVEFLEMISLNIDLYGNAYVFIQRNNAGRIIGLVPIHSRRIRMQCEDGDWFYVVDGKVSSSNVYSPDEIIHFRGLSIDGVNGVSLLTAAKESLSLGLSMQDFAARFFANDSSAGGILVHPQTIGDEGVQGLKNAWEQGRLGSSRHKVQVLQEGVKFERITIPNNDSQFLESRQFNVQEISDYTGVPPHMLGDLSRATFSNIEQQSIDFLNNTIRPALEKLEARFNHSLLPDDSRHFVQFFVEAQRSVDYKSKHEAVIPGLLAGAYTPNEARRILGLPPVDGGDTLRAPLNTAPVQDTTNARNLDVSVSEHRCGSDNEQASLPSPIETRALPEHTRIRDQYVERFEKIADELLEEEIPALRRIVEASENPDDLRRELEAYFSNHRSTVERKLEPLYREFMNKIAESNARDIDQEPPDLQEFIDNVIEAASIRWIRSSEDQLNALASIDERLSRLDEWSERRAGKFATVESNQVSNAATRATLVSLGITRLVWRTRTPCPLCDGLEGRTVGVQENFVSEGENVNGLIAPRALRQPPLHQGCQCYLSHE